MQPDHVPLSLSIPKPLADLLENEAGQLGLTTQQWLMERLSDYFGLRRPTLDRWLERAERKP